MSASIRSAAIMAYRPMTHSEAVSRNTAEYERLVTQGGFAPSTYPLNSLMFWIPFIYLMLPRRYNSLRLRLITVAAMFAATAHNIFFTRAKHASTSGLIGIMSVYEIMWGLANIGFVDAKTEHARIISVEPGDTNGFTQLTSTADQKPSSQMAHKTKAGHAGTQKVTYAWESCPDQFLPRLDWVADLFTNLDGGGWTWAVTSVAAPPPHVQKALARAQADDSIDTRLMEKKWARLRQGSDTTTASDMLRDSIKEFLIGYIIIDVLKTLVCLDPWFFGQLDAPPPPYMPRFLHDTFAVKGMRLLIGQGCVHYTIQNVIVLRAVAYLSPWLKKYVGVRGEAWVHSSPFGSFRFVLDNGLLGFWSRYWHSLFYHIFTAPTRAVVRRFKLQPQGILALALRLFIAFTFSGILHAGISRTSLGKTHPLSGSFMFFFMQPFGIIMQLVFAKAVSMIPGSQGIPKSVCQLSNVAWALLYGYLTGPLLIEDFARGGSFLLEPVPLSPLRGLGLGGKDNGFFCWRGTWFTWRSDGWHSGLEI